MASQGESVVVDIESPPDGHPAEGNVAECPICLEDKPLKDWIPPRWYRPFGRHRCCQECRSRYIAGLVREGHRADLPCFMPNCTDQLGSDAVREELQRFQPDLLQTYEEKLVKRYLLTTKDVIWCPGPNCQYAEIHTRVKRCPTLQCRADGCNTLICPKCKGKGHEGVDCPPPLQLEGVKTCPNCGVQIERTAGCRNMTCSVCNQQFCWTCGKPGWTHRHELLWNWPTHPCLSWPLHLALMFIFFIAGFFTGLFMGLSMWFMWVFAVIHQQPPHICLRVLGSIAMFIGFPIVGVWGAFAFLFYARNYLTACQDIERILISPAQEVRLMEARRMNTPT